METTVYLVTNQGICEVNFSKLALWYAQQNGISRIQAKQELLKLSRRKPLLLTGLELSFTVGTPLVRGRGEIYYSDQEYVLGGKIYLIHPMVQKASQRKVYARG